MSIKSFGRLDEGEIQEIEIASRAGARASILTYGAVLRDLSLPVGGAMQRTMLGLNSIEDYVAHSPSFGAVPGRFANRIANGRFEINGVGYQLQKKPGDAHTLHGGPKGFAKRIWKLEGSGENFVQLSLISPDGDMGFPGEAHVNCLYRFVEPATLRVEMTATADKPTPFALTQHAYFNLDGSPNILDHELTLACDFYTPTDSGLIPTGEILSVAGTAYDFRQPRAIRNANGVTYDTNIVVSTLKGEDGLAFVARLRSPKNGLTMELHTTEPGIQLYDAAKLDCPVPGLDGAHYGSHAGVCLEPQGFPDAPNQRHFPDRILRPGDAYLHISEFRFSL